MERSEFQQFMAGLKKDGLLEVSQIKAVWTFALEILVSSLVVIGLSNVERFGLLYWLLVIAGGVSLFRWFVIMHECGHKTL